MVSSSKKKVNSIKEMREKFGMSKQEFGDLIGLTRRQIYNIETGYTRITKPMAILMILLKDYELDYLKFLSERIKNDSES